MWISSLSDHSEFWCCWGRSWEAPRRTGGTAGASSKVSFVVHVEINCPAMRWTWQCVSLSAVTLSSTDRWDGRSSPSSAAWLTSATPSTGCHLASCGQDASPTGWWGWWVPSRLWLDWSRWTQAAVTQQIVHNYLIFMNEWKCWWKILNERMCRNPINVIRRLANHQWKTKKNPISQIFFFFFCCFFCCWITDTYTLDVHSKLLIFNVESKNKGILSQCYRNSSATPSRLVQLKCLRCVSANRGKGVRKVRKWDTNTGLQQEK